VKTSEFQQGIDSVEKLSLEDQEILLSILQSLRPLIEQTLLQLSEDPFVPSLRTHDEVD
jgi:hypothetical protein